MIISGTKIYCDNVDLLAECRSTNSLLLSNHGSIVADDLFLWRSFAKDLPTILKNIQHFHSTNERRMLFLSSEGVVVDFGQHDKYSTSAFLINVHSYLAYVRDGKLTKCSLRYLHTEPRCQGLSGLYLYSSKTS
ncbi:hypothetical protein ACHAW5_008590 [Stephanodiscus triporus]|uniref:Uncharacterized protein n=1 Tax=Stephanodiscus triporus TaxID=2934178 RepID=A0ABD3MT78_9STRA